MISAIIVCFPNASSNLTLRWSPVLPPGMQGTRGVWGGIQNHALLRQEAVTLLVRCGWGGDDHTWQQNISRGPGLRRLLTERLYAAGAAEGAWTPMEEAGSSGLCCIQRSPGCSRYVKFPAHTQPPLCTANCGWARTTRREIPFCFLRERAEKWAAQGIWQGEEWKADSCQQLSCKIALEAAQGAW